MFEKLSEFEFASLSAQIKQEISKHVQSLENDFRKYFPNLAEGSEVFSRNPFSPMLDITTIPEEVQDELLDLKNDSASRKMFMIKSSPQF